MCRHVIDSEKIALIVEMVSLWKVDSLANTKFVTHEKKFYLLDLVPLFIYLNNKFNAFIILNYASICM